MINLTPGVRQYIYDVSDNNKNVIPPPPSYQQNTQRDGTGKTWYNSNAIMNYNNVFTSHYRTIFIRDSPSTPVSHDAVYKVQVMKRTTRTNFRTK